MKNTKKIIACFLICTTVFSACQKAPEEVKERMGDYGENAQVTKSELQYTTVDGLKKTKISDISTGLDNMVLPETVDFSKIEELAVLDMAYQDKYSDYIDKYIKMFGIDKSTIEVNNHGVGRRKLYESDNSAARTYFALDNNGFISYISDLSYDYTYDKVQEVDTIETYDLEEDDISEKTIQFGKNKESIPDMIAAAEDWLEKNMALDFCRYHVSDVYVRNLTYEKGSAMQLSLMAQIIYKGVALDPYPSGFEKGAEGPVSQGQTKIDMNYEGKDKLTFFANCNGGIKVNGAKPVTKIVDLESAVRLVNETLAGFNQLKISRLIPLYMLVPKYSKKNPDFASPGQKMEGRPVYAFFINTDFAEPTEFGIVRQAEHYVYVDMITGEVMTDFEIKEEDK